VSFNDLNVNHTIDADLIKFNHIFILFAQLNQVQGTIKKQDRNIKKKLEII